MVKFRLLALYHNSSIRFRLVVVYSTLAFLILGILSWQIYLMVVTNLEGKVNQNLQERAEEARLYFATHTEFTPQDLADFEQALLGAAPVDIPPETGRTGLPRPTPVPVSPVFKSNCCDLAASLTYLRVTLLRGQVWSLPNVEVMTLRETKDALDKLWDNSAKLSSFATLRLKGGELVRVYTIPLAVRGQVVGHIQTVRSLVEFDSIVSNLTIPIILIVLAAIGFLALIGWMVTLQAFAPVEQITAAAYRIGVNNNLAERIEIDSHSNDEVARLGRAFNAMLDRLEKSFKSQKQFIADSSHELRTPLTVIRGNLDLLKRNPDPKNQAESLGAMERETARMQRLVQDLLLLAQADAKQTIELLPLQLDTLVLDVYMNTRVLADARHQTLKLGHFDPVMLDGDADRLKRAILNLVDNALKYTPEGGTITLALYKGKKWARVVVADNGPGIAEKDQALIFDRFYRVDKARSRGSGSTGLGLAIVQHIAEAHGGRVTLESEEGKGSTFNLWLYYKSADDTDFSDEDDLEEFEPEKPETDAKFR
ncbi:MAG: HAMP domain-containing sensor histidine kinase [Chloroflexota bacterium]|nr:HAMP domain-containing histidine kinase [Chloroflexota bacterium]